MAGKKANKPIVNKPATKSAQERRPPNENAGVDRPKSNTRKEVREQNPGRGTRSNLKPFRPDGREN